MKQVFKKVFLTATVLGAAQLEAAPFYRIWRGYQNPQIESREKFQEAIAKVFVSATVETGAGYALTGYIPTIPNQVANSTILIPDEVALVVYESEEKYKELRATPIGKNYGDLHWKYFVRPPLDPAAPIPSNASKSTVPAVVGDSLTLENGKAYDFLNSTPDWQKSVVKTRFLKRNSDAVTELDLLKKIKDDFAPQAEGYLVLVDANYLMIYEAWESKEALAKSDYEKFLKTNFEELGASIQAAPTAYGLAGMQGLTIKEGESLNAQFDATQKAVYVETPKVEAFISESLKKIEESFSTFFDLTLEAQNDPTAEDGSYIKVERTYELQYEDENGLPAIHSTYLEYLLKKTELSPSGTVLLIKDGVEEF